MSFKVRIEGSDVTFACEPGQTVLEAAWQSGVALPHACRQGVCGNCATRVPEGTVLPKGNLPLRNEVCANDEVLLCAATAGSDLSIAPRHWQSVDPTARKIYTAKVFSHERPAPDVSVLRLRLTVGQRLRFTAGQYLQLRLPDGGVRSYSMANPPHESDGVMLHVRHVPGGQFTRLLSSLSAGDTLQFEAPLGHIALPSEDVRPMVFVAGGTGFAPIKSILDDWYKRQVQRPITLIWGARGVAGIYLPKAIDKWRRAWPAMRVVMAISEAQSVAMNEVPAEGSPAWLESAFAGRVDQALEAICPDLRGHVVYACGSPAMVDAVRKTALHAGLASTDLHADTFVPAAQNA